MKIELVIKLRDKIEACYRERLNKGADWGNWKTYQLLTSVPTLHSAPSLWFKINSQKGGLRRWVER